MITLQFQHGTIAISGIAELPDFLTDLVKPDPRSGNFRARACDYAPIVLALLKNSVPFSDQVRDYAPLHELQQHAAITPRPHQQQALDAWKHHDCRGITALPTGSGKTVLAMLAIAHLQRPALILVPTIDLLTQWCREIEKFFH